MYWMLFKGSKCTQMLPTKQGCTLCTHTHNRYCGILLNNWTLCQENWGAGKTIHSTGPSEITQNWKPMVSRTSHLEGTWRLLFVPWNKDYLGSVLEQRTLTSIKTTEIMVNDILSCVSTTTLVHQWTNPHLNVKPCCWLHSTHSCIHLCLTYIPLK